MSSRLRLFLLVAATILTGTRSEEYHDFDGEIGQRSSWYEAERWTGSGLVPSSEDNVTIDSANTYVAIDDSSVVAKVAHLIIGKSEAGSGPFQSVQLDLLEDNKLQVTNDMTIGDEEGSDGTVYAQEGSHISVGGVATVGNDGDGVLILTESAKLSAKDLQIRTTSGSRSRVILGHSASLELEGNKEDALNDLIGNRFIAPSKVSDTLKAVLNAEKTKTTVTISSCSNRVFAYKNKASRDCKWVGKKKNRRCKKKWKKERLSDHCPMECKAECLPPIPPKPCPDKDLKFQDKRAKNCKWVGKKKGRRCKKKWKGQRLADFCPGTCNACPAASASTSSNGIVLE